MNTNKTFFDVARLCDTIATVSPYRYYFDKDLGQIRIKHMYNPVRIIYNNPATIVFWEDGTKTVVKKAKGEKFNKYYAFCAALAKKVYGNNSRVNRIVNSNANTDTSKKSKKSKD